MVDEIQSDNRVGLACSDEIDISRCINEFYLVVKLKNLNLTVGKYRMNFWVGIGDVYTSLHYYDRVFDSLTFEVDTHNRKSVNYWASDWGFSHFVCEVNFG